MNDSGDSIIFSYISNPIEHGPHTGKGKLWAMLNHDRPLTNRQKRLLDSLPDTGSRVVVRKSAASMSDLAALTAETKDEFAMFTRGPKRLIVRGGYGYVDVDYAEAQSLAACGYKWSGHTHPTRNLVPSAGDQKVLGYFAQERSVIYDTYGNYNRFPNTQRKEAVVCT